MTDGRRDRATSAVHTIHDPREPSHFMRLKPARRHVRVRHGGRTLCETTEAVWLLEVGKDLYDPVLYVPRRDVAAALLPIDKTTHCPLKGDASYFDLADGDGAPTAIAWSYEAPFAYAADLAGLIAFDPAKVTIEIAPGATRD